MNKPHLHLMRSLLPVIALSACTQAQTTVLFIGNSYTGVNNLPNTFQQLSASLGRTVTTAMQTPGGWTLEQHSTTQATLDAIASQPWTHVVLQEQSQCGGLPPTYCGTAAGADALVQAIHANATCTRPILYMTWGRQNGDSQTCADFPYMCTYDGMQQALRDNYVALAEEHDAFTAPVGAAWRHVRETHPLINLYQGDGSHPSVEGTYLAACVFYCTVFGESCAAASFTSTVQPDTAAILRNIASTVTLDSLATWNLDLPPLADAAFTSSSSNAWNEVTYHHGGAGTHLWTCSDGQSSTLADVTFVFAEPGTYELSHTYTDPCGNSATATWTQEVIVAGVPGSFGKNGRPFVHIEAGSLNVHGSGPQDAVTLTDASGRTIGSQPMANGRARFQGIHGMVVVTITDGQGVRWTEPVFVP